MASLAFEPVPALEGRRRTPGLIVMKFGGTSVGDTEKLKRVAVRLVSAREAGAKVVAVLSAMGSTTDELIRLAHEVSPTPHPREYDMLVSTGERISNALCAMAIHDLGHEAVSFTGSQAGIVTDASHTKAKIVEVRAQRIHEALDANKIEQRLAADQRIHALDQRRQIAFDDEILAFVHERFDRVRNSLTHALDHEPPAVEFGILFRARESEFLLDDLPRQDEP